MFAGSQSGPGGSHAHTLKAGAWRAERAGPERDAAVVTYQCADVGWIVRHVLQYGPEAEVIEPEVCWDAVRGAVGSH